MPFIDANPTREDCWRSVVLFGRNVACYKFALAKSLLELANKEKDFVRLDELAFPYAKYIAEHVKQVDKQGTSRSSQFLHAVRQYNKGELEQDALIRKTVSLGFENVIDAFHIVNEGPIPTRFFVDDRKQRRGIIITDELIRLKESIQFPNLPIETEARWRLVETAWQAGLNPALLSVQYDLASSSLFVNDAFHERIDVTSSRHALNGYQRGACFYCGSSITVVPRHPALADVDHFFPHTLLTRAEMGVNLNGVWNLVLACRECNRGEKGKAARVPKLKYLERLHDRNNHLIESHHPLRDTLISQTGTTKSL